MINETRDLDSSDMSKASDLPDDIPRLKRKVLDDLLGLPLESETKKRLMNLKHNHDVDHLEWIRKLIRDNLPLIEKKLDRGA